MVTCNQTHNLMQ